MKTWLLFYLIFAMHVRPCYAPRPRKYTERDLTKTLAETAVDAAYRNRLEHAKRIFIDRFLPTLDAPPAWEDLQYFDNKQRVFCDRNEYQL